MIVYPTTACPEARLYPVPMRSTKAIPCYVKVGCRNCTVCDAEKVQAKQLKWRSRIREMILHYQSNGDRVVFATLTVHDADYPSYEELKSRLSKLFNAMRRRFGSAGVKYWCVLEEGAKTKRLHAHVFFFVKKEFSWYPIWEWIQDYWTTRYKAYILHTRVVTSASMAAAYATKYAVKQIGYKRDRMMSSQFGWVSFMEGRRRQWLGLDEETEGVDTWLAVSLPDVEEEVVRSNVVGAVNLKRFVGSVKIAGRIWTDRKALHPYASCITQMEGELCEESEEGTDPPRYLHSYMWVPDISKWQQLIQLGSERLLQACLRRLD